MARFVRVAAVVLGVLALSVGSGRAAAPGAVADLPGIIAPLLDSVVNITILKPPQPMGADRGESDRGKADGGAPLVADRKWERGYGSGFIISSDGLVVTNRHVVEDAVKITVTLHDERQFDATLVASNATPDLALLRIEGQGTRFAPVRWGPSEALRLGETVVAVGNPLGLSTSITVGVVSALGRNVRSSLVDDYIQTDAAINRGSSGGPLFNLKGEVVGVHWAMITPTAQSGSVGLGLSIPSEIAAVVVEQLRAHGALQAGYPGMRLQPLMPAMARVLGMPEAEGGIVAQVMPGGPAARAGLREGDVVVQFGSRSGVDSRHMLRELWVSPPGTRLPVRFVRAGRELRTEIELDRFPPGVGPAGPPPLPELGPRVTDRLMGLRVAELTEATRRAFGVKHGRPGLVVEGVAANSVGAGLGLSRGDLILRVAETPVETADALADALARSRGETGTVMQVEMDGAIQWIVVPAAGVK